MSARAAAVSALPPKCQQCGSAAAQLYLPLNFPSHPVKGWPVVLLPQQPPRCKILQYVWVQKLDGIFIVMRSTSCSLCCSHACKSRGMCPRTAALHGNWTDANRTGFSAPGAANSGMEGHAAREAADFSLCFCSPRLPPWCFAKAVYSM